MSIFKVKYWWSTDSLHTKETVSGSQNAYSLKVDRFNSHSDSDCILLAEESTIKVFKPNIEQENSHTLLESELEDVILQIETGKFVRCVNLFLERQELIFIIDFSIVDFLL